MIPDEARGRAYVQNHPGPAGERAYDAVNEVWFDDVAGRMQTSDVLRTDPPPVVAFYQLIE